MAETADVIIKNGTVVNGTGRRAFQADLTIHGPRITSVGPTMGATARRVIDARGKVVCPGFVDIHSHADLFAHDPDQSRVFEPLIRQGITSFLGGNCGFGLAPIDRTRNVDAQRIYLEGVTRGGFDESFTWGGTGEYLDTLDHHGVALNVGVLCPHGLLRLQAMGPSTEHASADHVRRMGRTLEQALEEGAFGLSTGLQYFPGMHSDSEELVRLGAHLKKRGGRFTSHIRSYTVNTLRQALEEVARVATTHGVHAQVSHIFTLPWMGRLNDAFMRGVKFLAKHHRLANAVVPDAFVCADMRKTMDWLDARRRQGIRLGMDMMPTTTGFTHMLAFFPPWVLEGGGDEINRRLKSPEMRQRIITDVERGVPAWPHNGDRDWSLNFFRMFGYDCATIMAVGSKENQHLAGKRLVDIASQRRVHPLEAAMDLLLEEDRQVLVFGSPGEPEDPFTVRTQYPALAHPEVSMATDTLLLGLGKPSYLFYGCYPRFLGHHVRKMGLVDLETAVRKCTLLPAESAGFRDRGKLAGGCFADVVIFDEGRIGTDADFRNPDRFPRGIEQVLINGEVVLDGDKYNEGALAGMVLRRG